jgi:GntR family transcriptional regulator, transcriptional repressor for pyruvate dehydrogenase complex
MESIKPIKRIKISDEVLSQLKLNIISGIYQPNERLPSEGTLCQLFQVSRISIRTALHKLEAIGLIEIRNGEGAFVRGLESGCLMLPLLQDLQISPGGILELLEFREAVEKLSCRLAAERGLPEEAILLEQIYQQMERFALQGDQEGFTQADVAFHRQIARMSGNTFIIRVLDIVDEFYQAHLHRMNQTISLVFSLDSHRNLASAIKEKNKEEAARIISASIQDSIREVRQWQT